jgi:four helix bundle protein
MAGKEAGGWGLGARGFGLGCEYKLIRKTVHGQNWKAQQLSIFSSVMKTKIQSFKDLHVWQKAMGLANSIYEVTSAFSKAERYGLVSQMRRAAVSIPSNIAEGNSRNTTGEYRQFLGIAKGSHAELETLILLSCKIGYLTELKTSELLELSSEVGRMLNGLIRSLR